MNLDKEFKEARDWVANEYSITKADHDISFFETTIRILGGFLSAYELSRDQLFLEKADEIGESFLPVFDTPSGIPYCSINLNTGRASNPFWTAGSSILSEVGTIQLEFSYLSKHTNKDVYKEKAMKVYDVLDKASKPDGLYPVYVDIQDGEFSKPHITLGALGDSFYEYLMKMWLLTNGKDTKSRAMYDAAAKNIIDQLVQKSTPNGLTYIAEKINGQLNHKMDHLVCFAGAMFALGATGETKDEHFKIGEEITRTCNEMYVRTETGIAPEIVKFNGNNDFDVPSDAHHYLLRPETAESFFVLWRLTHNPIYREWGWKAFQAIDKYCKTTYGYSGIRDVTNTNVEFDNLQQSFFLAETLKYFYLLFSDDTLIPLDKYVFNTEAHPLGIFED